MNAIQDIAGFVLKAGAPILGGILQTAATAAGGPGAGALVGVALSALKSALGLDPSATAEEVAATIKADPAAATVAAGAAEAQHGAALDELAASHMALNATQAASPDFFVSGSRPFLMWVCASAILHQALIAPVFSWFSVLVHLPVWPVVPEGVFSLIATLTGGLFVVRGVEKYFGTARETMASPQAKKGAR